MPDTTAATCAELAAAGIGPHSRVAIAGANHPGLPGLLAALACRGAVACLIGSKVPDHERERRLTACQADVLVDDAAHPWLNPGARPCVDTPDVNEQVSATDHPALAIFSSGSTGAARALVLGRAGLAAVAAASSAALGLTSSDHYLTCLPMDHIGGVMISWRCWHSGASQHVMRSFDAAAINQAIERDGVTAISLVPTMLQRLLDDRGDRPWPSSLRVIMLGGASIAPDLLEASAALGCQPITSYGLTEMSGTTCLYDPATAPSAALANAGPPLAGNQVRIGPDHRIEVCGPGHLQGELVNGELVPCAEGWIRTNDLGQIEADGSLTVLGRSSELIVSGGENVYPAEVEHTLARHPLIAAAVVWGQPSPEWGETVVAAIVCLNAAPDEATLSAWCAEHLAPAARPRRWHYADSLPVTARGKPDRGAVRAHFGD